MVAPTAVRVMLFAPSQPSTASAHTSVSVPDPRSRYRTRTGSSPSAPCSTAMTSTLPRKCTCGSAASRSRSTCSSSGWWNMLACGKPWAWPEGSRVNSARTRCSASTSCMPGRGREMARTCSAMPICAKMRNTSSSKWTARGNGYTSRHRSRSRHSMPRWASMIAALAPVGPAPTITTGTGSPTLRAQPAHQLGRQPCRHRARLCWVPRSRAPSAVRIEASIRSPGLR